LVISRLAFAIIIMAMELPFQHTNLIDILVIAMIILLRIFFLPIIIICWMPKVLL